MAATLKRCAVLGAASVVLGGCTSQRSAAVPGDSTRSTPSANAPHVPNVVAVHASDYAFDAPAQIPAGLTTFQLTNDGPGLHHMAIVRLDSGKTFTDLQRALQHPGPPPRWAVMAGGPNATEPHGESNATLDVSAGNYVLMCFVDLPGGVPHFAKGMSRALTVTPTSAPLADAPIPDITVVLSDYKFDVSGAVSAGRHTFVVRTAVGQPHELEIIRLNSGKTAQDFITWINRQGGPPPGHAVGGVTAATPDTPVYFTADLPSGSYALICFIPDASDGKPHFLHGMVKTVTVS